MGKHSRDEPPPPAARERARLTRPAIVAAAAAAAVAVALTAAAWALSRPGAPPTLAGPDPASSAGPSAIEGFGQASPSVPAVVRTSRPPLSPSPGVSSHAPRPSQLPSPVSGSSVSASYTISAWPDAYKMEFILSNPTANPALWTVRLQAPDGARLDQLWNAEVTQESATVWLLRPPRWDGGNPRPIAPGGEFLFGLIVEGAQTVVSCTLDGAPCRRA